VFPTCSNLLGIKDLMSFFFFFMSLPASFSFLSSSLTNDVTPRFESFELVTWHLDRNFFEREKRKDVLHKEKNFKLYYAVFK